MDLAWLFRGGIPAILAILLSGLASPKLCAQDRLSVLKQNRLVVLESLKRVEEGAEPCFSEICQFTKRSAAGNLHQELERLPDQGFLFIHSYPEGINETFRMIRNPFAKPDRKNFFPKTLSEWVSYWKLRYSYESQAKAAWSQLYLEIYSLREALQLYDKIIKANSEDRELIEEAWKRGLGNALFSLSEASRLKTLSNEKKAQGDLAESNRLEKLAFASLEKYEQINKTFGNNLRDVTESIFLGASFNQVVVFADLISQVQAKNPAALSLFGSEMQAQMSYYFDGARNIAKSAQTFNDLEYGLVGIKNFESLVNPVNALEQEIPIQDFLDKVDATGRIFVDLASYYFMMTTGKIFFGKMLGMGIFPSLLQIYSAKKDFEVSNFLWEPSTRSRELQDQLPKFREEMSKRFTELLRAQRLMKAKLAQIDDEIKTLEENE